MKANIKKIVPGLSIERGPEKIRDLKLVMPETYEVKNLLTAGRRPDNDVSFGGSGISGYHFIILPDGGRYKLLDMSRNGTYVNREKVQGETHLKNGDRIGFTKRTDFFQFTDEGK